MLSRISDVLHNAVDALSPSVLQDDFIYHWKMIMKFYINKTHLITMPVEDTNIGGHLDQLLKLLVEEEASVNSGSTGPCLEYLLHHNLLDLLVTFGCADTPPGMKKLTFCFVRKLIMQIQQPLIPHVSIYIPVQRLINICNGNNAYPTEKDEVEFLCTLCAIISKSPHLISVLNNKPCGIPCTFASYDSPELPKTFVVDNQFMESVVDDSENYEGKINQTLQNTQKSVNCQVEMPDTDLQTNNDLFGSESPDGAHFPLIDKLTSYICSADSWVTIKACEGLMVIASLGSDELCKSIVQNTNLCMALATHLHHLYEAVPMDINPNEVDDLHVQWGFDGPPWTDETKFDGCHEIAAFLCWLDYCNQFISEANPVIGCELTWLVRQQFLEPMKASLGSEDDLHVLFCTTILGKCMKYVTEPYLVTEFASWIIGENQESSPPGMQSSTLVLLLNNCLREQDDICLESLRLFEILLDKKIEYIYESLVLRYLNKRSYFNHASEVSYSWSSEEEAAHSSDVKMCSAPGVTRIINRFMYLLPEHLHSTIDPDERGYEQYIQDADRLYKENLSHCKLFGWPSEAVFPECDDTASSDSQPEADHRTHFYEGPFLKMIFTRMLKLPYQSYQVNLQLTGLVSRLAMLPNPYLHEFLLNPFLPVTEETTTLFNILEAISNELITQIPNVSDYKPILFETRQRLLGGDDLEQDMNSVIYESLIVLEEFCKELSAIAFVKNQGR